MPCSASSTMPELLLPPNLVAVHFYGHPSVGIYGRVRRLQIKIPTRRTTKNMLREMDQSSLPLDAQCRAAEEELGQRVRVDRLLLIRSPSNSRSTIPRTSSPERRKCTASNGIRACRRNTVRRTARSDHAAGGEWMCLFATHANPSDSAEAINRMSVLHLHFI